MKQESFHLQSAIAESRDWLVGYCAALAGNRDAAEDLAQETLIEAWRHVDRLQSPAAWRAWLAGIARNVARRWRRAEAARPASTPLDPDALPTAFEIDPEKRYLDQELIATVRSALRTVPEASREALIAHCLLERSQATVATDLGIDEPAVSSRVYRGKRALRSALVEPGRREALAAYGFEPEPEPDDAWRATRIYCPLCGQGMLGFRQDVAGGRLSVRCRGYCSLNPEGNIIGSTRLLPEAHRLASPKAILTRHLLSIHADYQTTFTRSGRPCVRCGEFVPLRIGAAESRFPAGVYLKCPGCDALDDTSLWHLALDHPATQRFWRRYPRMRALPIDEVEHEGEPALLTGFENTRSTARIEVRYSPDRYDVLRIETVAAG